MSIPHYAWAAGHAAVLLTSLYCIIGIVTFKPHPYAYKLAYSGASISWGIVVYKSLGIPSLSRAYAQRALLDENVQYLLLALYWMIVEKPIPLTLIPFATFSLFHTLTFVRSLLPKATSSSSSSKKTDKPSPAGTKPPPTGAAVELNKKLQTWIKGNYEKAMQFVSFFEVIVVMGRLILGAVTFRNSLLTPLFYAHFLRLRYYLSPQTRTAFAYVSSQIDKLKTNPSCPEVVKKALDTARDLTVRYSNSILQQASQGQGGPGGAAPQGQGNANANVNAGPNAAR